MRTRTVGAPPRRAIAISRSRSSPTTSVRRGVRAERPAHLAQRRRRRLAERDAPARRSSGGCRRRRRPTSRVRGPPLTEKTGAVEVARSGAPAQTESQAARSCAYVGRRPSRRARRRPAGRSRSRRRARAAGRRLPGPPSTSTDLPGCRRAIQRAATTAGFMNSSSASVEADGAQIGGVVRRRAAGAVREEEERRPLARDALDRLDRARGSGAAPCTPPGSSRVEERAVDVEDDGLDAVEQRSRAPRRARSRSPGASTSTSRGRRADEPVDELARADGCPAARRPWRRADRVDLLRRERHAQQQLLVADPVAVAGAGVGEVEPVLLARGTAPPRGDASTFASTSGSSSPGGGPYWPSTYFTISSGSLRPALAGRHVEERPGRR